MLQVSCCKYYVEERHASSGERRVALRPLEEAAQQEQAVL